MFLLFFNCFLICHKLEYYQLKKNSVMIRIAIITEKELDLKTIAGQLSSQPDYQIIGTGKSGYDALKTAAGLQPDIIIMDHVMSDSNSSELAPILKRKSPGTELIIISSSENKEWIGLALKSGISGLLIKQADMDELVTAIRTVHCGAYYFGSSIKNQVAKAFSNNTTKTILNPKACLALLDVSATERKIIHNLALGYSDKEIADDLHIATGTIRNSMNGLKRKTGLKSRIQLITYALICGLLTEPL